MSEKMVKTAKINKWKPKSNQLIVDRDGKLFICHFDKVVNESLKIYNRFLLGKESYINQLDVITNYINFFINFYDTDNEVVMAYLKVKFAIDKNKLYTKENMKSYIEFIYDVLFTPNIVDKIIQMIEDNYIDDIEGTTDYKKKYVKNEKKHLESLEFNNQHVKILLAISFSIKLMAPVLFHYIQINNIKIEKNSDTIFRFYSRLFGLFGHSSKYEKVRGEDDIIIEADLEPDEIEKIISEKELRPVRVGDDVRYYFIDESDSQTYYYTKSKINVYNKLYVYVKAKVLESNSTNATIFAQREIFGTDVSNVISNFTKRVVISENMVKYKINENIIGFNKTILKFQLSYFLKEQYDTNLTEVTNAKNSEGLSGSDKMLMNANKIDEGKGILSDLNIDLTMKKIRKIIDVPITEEEILYYKENHVPSPIQIELVYAYYSRFFGNYVDLNLLTRLNYIELLLRLKKKLLIDLGYEEDSNGRIHYASLPYILTGNVTDKVNTRIIRNNAVISKIEKSYSYQKLINEKYRNLESLKPKIILQKLSAIINTRFTYVTYEYPELLGTEIIYPDDKIIDELLNFLCEI